MKYIKISNVIIDYGYRGLHTKGSDNLVSDSIIKNQNRDGILVQGTRFTLMNSTISDNDYHGILFDQGGSNSFIYNNTIEDSGGRGVYIDHASNIRISFNTITDSSGTDASDSGAGIWIEGSSVQNIRILNNTIKDNKHGIHTWGGQGPTDISVIGNQIIGNEKYGVRSRCNIYL